MNSRPVSTAYESPQSRVTPDGTTTLDIGNPDSSLVSTLPPAKCDKPRIYCSKRRKES